MSFDGNPARFLINDEPSEDANGNRGVIVANGDPVVLKLEAIPSGALSARFELYDPTSATSPLASLDAPLLTFAGSGTSAELLTDPDNEEATFTMATAGANPTTDIHAYIVRCTVSTAEGPYIFERMVVTAGTSSGLRKSAPGESQEYHARGWSDELNKMIDALEAGLGGGGGFFTSLLDTPGSYAGDAGKILKVSDAANAIAFSGVLIDASNNLISPGGAYFAGDVLELDSTNGAQLRLSHLGAAADEKFWQVYAQDDLLAFGTLDDTGLNFQSCFTLERTGNSASSFTVHSFTRVAGHLAIDDQMDIASTGVNGAFSFFRDLTQALNEKAWGIGTNGDFVIRALNDDLSTPFDVMTFERGAGNTVDEVNLDAELDMNEHDVFGDGDHYASNFIADDSGGDEAAYSGFNGEAPFLTGGGEQGDEIPWMVGGTIFGAGATFGGTFSLYLGSRDPEGAVTVGFGTGAVYLQSTDVDASPRTRLLIHEGGNGSNTDWRELSKHTFGALRKMRLSRYDASTVSIANGECRSDDDRFDIRLSGAEGFPVDLAASGAGGLDTGAEASSTWYSVWAIADSTEVEPASALLSLSSSAPTLPAGYDKKRLLGWIYNDSSGDIRPFAMFGEGRDRYVLHDLPRSERNVFTDQEPTTWTVASLATFLPVGARICDLEVDLQADAGDYVELRSVTAHADAEGLRVTCPAAAGTITDHISNFVATGVQELEYRRNNANGNGASLYVRGYQISL